MVKSYDRDHIKHYRPTLPEPVALRQMLSKERNEKRAMKSTMRLMIAHITKISEENPNIPLPAFINLARNQAKGA